MPVSLINLLQYPSIEFEEHLLHLWDMIMIKMIVIVVFIEENQIMNLQYVSAEMQFVIIARVCGLSSKQKQDSSNKVTKNNLRNNKINIDSDTLIH